MKNTSDKHTLYYCIVITSYIYIYIYIYNNKYVMHTQLVRFVLLIIKEPKRRLTHMLYITHNELYVVM